MHSRQIFVEFYDPLSTQDVAAALIPLSSPHVILWYIGCNGLKRAGMEFYREHIIDPIWNANPSAVFWLLDLTAWNAFKRRESSLFAYNSCCDVLEAFGDERIRCIKTSRIFEKMSEPGSEEWDLALEREFLSDASKPFPPSSIRIGDIFPPQSMIRSLNDWDCAHAYSAVQYLEGCLIVEEILARCKAEELVFLLPNDELKYYRDAEGSFAKDVQRTVSPTRPLRIRFLSFPYGAEPHHRPYNAPGAVVKKNTLSHQDFTHIRMVNHASPHSVSR